jgi:organic radical activating enzyme
MVEIDGLVNNIMDMLPYNEWRDEHLVITGGEPLLGWQRAYPELLGHEKMKSLKHLTFETNGTQMLTTEFASWLHREFHHDRGIHSVTFSISPKLSISGEKREDAIKPEVVAQLDEYGYAYLKFVVASEEDVTEALEMTELYRDAGFGGPVYLMPLGGIESTYHMNKTQVANLALKHGLRYSDRLHVPLFKNAWGT